jgi:hypothetical protein
VITTATVRVAGETQIDIGVSHLGAPEQEVSLRTGELLIYLRDPGVAQLVVNAWRQSRPLVGALPHVAAISRLHLTPRVGMVGVIARLGGTPFCGASWVPSRAGVAEPDHIRLDVGPVSLQICDHAAWHALGRAWLTVHRHLAGEPAGAGGRSAARVQSSTAGPVIPS